MDSWQGAHIPFSHFLMLAQTVSLHKLSHLRQENDETSREMGISESAEKGFTNKILFAFDVKRKAVCLTVICFAALTVD